ncbi:MAG: divalent-cation tolerance protein CutA [Candidatus Omnitrophica bacterium]|nr:divalent-cation tolerance protein CutA [Candidatus Omnitrophota bacterium]
MYSIVFVTVKGNEEAKKIADTLVIEKLVACVNMIDQVKSVFWWKGEVQYGEEILLIMKTKDSALPQLIARIKLLHSYTVPEIISVPIKTGNPDYLKWIGDSVVDH